MFHTFTRVDKRAFTKAFSAGEIVAMGRTPRDETAETFVGRGFTSASVADPFADTGRGGVLRYWVAVAGSETPVGPVEYVPLSKPWGFRCDECAERILADSEADAEALRAAHEHIAGPGFALDADGESDVTGGEQFARSVATGEEESFEARLGVNYHHEHLAYWVSVEDIEGNVNGLWIEAGAFLAMCERMLGGSSVTPSVAPGTKPLDADIDPDGIMASCAVCGELTDYCLCPEGPPLTAEVIAQEVTFGISAVQESWKSSDFDTIVSARDRAHEALQAVTLYLAAADAAHA